MASTARAWFELLFIREVHRGARFLQGQITGTLLRPGANVTSWERQGLGEGSSQGWALGCAVTVPFAGL